MVRRPSAHDSRARVLIAIFVGPLRDTAFEVHDAKRTRALREGAYIRECMLRRSGIDWRQRVCVPVVAPRIQTLARRLGGILPLPLVRQALAGPGGIGA